MERIHYSIIQYRPNSFRSENMNVGILLFTPKSVEKKIISEHKRIRSWDPSFSDKEFESEIEYLIDFMQNTEKSVNELVKLYLESTLYSNVGLTSLRYIDAEEIPEHQYVSILDKLYKTLVKPPVPIEKELEVEEKRFRTLVRNDLSDRKLLATKNTDKGLLQDYKPKLPRFPTDYSFNFGVKTNGLYDLLETVEFEYSMFQKSKLARNAAFASSKFALVNNLNIPANSYTVYRAKPDMESQLSDELYMLERFSKIFNYNSKDDRAKLFEILNERLLGQHYL